MIERANNTQFDLFSKERGWLYNVQIRNYGEVNGDTFKKESKRGSFSVKKQNDITFFAFGYDENDEKVDVFDYLIVLFRLYGTRPDCRFIQRVKSDDRRDQRWKTISNVGLDLANAQYISKTKEVTVPTTEGGMIKDIEAFFNDEYDILPNDTIDGTILDDLPTVTVQIDPRQIARRSKLFLDEVFDINSDGFVEQTINTTVIHEAIPFSIKTNDDQHNISAPSGQQGLNLDGEISTTFLNITPAASIYDFKGRVVLNRTGTNSLNIENPSFHITFAVYSGIDKTFQYDRPIYGSTNGDFNPPDRIDVSFNERFELDEDSSVALLIFNFSSKLYTYERPLTVLNVNEDQLYPTTTCRAIRPFDLIERLVAITTGQKEAFKSDIFGEGGVYENNLITCGNWLRNVPDIINEGEEDEKRTQIKASIQKIYEGFGIREPLTYDVITEGDKEYFTIEPKIDTFRNFSSIELGETRDGSFEYKTLLEEESKPLDQEFYTKITIGSTKTGNDYEEVNNLYSVCGNATWNTNNKADESIEYSATTEIRTGAEDVELTRQIQYEDYPELDNERDDDLFILDCKPQGNIYVLKKWDDYYSTPPKNVYSFDTNYNWPFTPARLLLKHSWKINVGLYQYPNETIRLASSNCNRSLITQVAGEEELKEGERINTSLFDKPPYKPMSVTARLSLNQEIQDMLRGQTRGIDNKYGRIKAMVEAGHIEEFYLSQVQENDPGQWELIEAY